MTPCGESRKVSQGQDLTTTNAFVTKGDLHWNIGEAQMVEPNQEVANRSSPHVENVGDDRGFLSTPRACDTSETDRVFLLKILEVSSCACVSLFAEEEGFLNYFKHMKNSHENRRVHNFRGAVLAARRCRRYHLACKTRFAVSADAPFLSPLFHHGANDLQVSLRNHAVSHRENHEKHVSRTRLFNLCLLFWAHTVCDCVWLGLSTPRPCGLV